MADSAIPEQRQTKKKKRILLDIKSCCCLWTCKSQQCCLSLSLQDSRIRAESRYMAQQQQPNILPYWLDDGPTTQWRGRVRFETQEGGPSREITRYRLDRPSVQTCPFPFLLGLFDCCCSDQSFKVSTLLCSAYKHIISAGEKIRAMEEEKKNNFFSWLNPPTRMRYKGTRTLHRDVDDRYHWRPWFLLETAMSTWHEIETKSSFLYFGY